AQDQLRHHRGPHTRGRSRVASRPDASHVRPHLTRPDQPGLDSRAGNREPRRSLRPLCRRHPERHLRQRSRANNHRLCPLGRSDHVAKASIIGNVLLVLGASLLFGGLIGIQSFSATIAGV
ncbi:MAG: Ca(2+)/H(+) antiporter, partial [uncultured Chloroflexia bacterium]